MSHYVGDISVFDIDSGNILALFDNVTLTTSNDTADTASLVAKGTRSSILKTSGTIAVNLRSTGTAMETASHFDASALALGATSFPCFQSTGININYSKVVDPCVGSRYKVEVNTKLNLTANITVMAQNGYASALFTPFDKDAALSASNATYTVAFNGTTFEFPVLIQQVELTGERDGLQTLNVALEGRCPNTGDFPTTPTGTTGLLAKALNAYTTPLAFNFRTKASTGGVVVSGNVYFDSVTFEIADEQIVPVSYNFRNAGGWDFVAGS